MLMGKQPFPPPHVTVRMCVSAKACTHTNGRTYTNMTTHTYAQGSAFKLHIPHSQAINIFPFPRVTKLQQKSSRQQ